MSAGMCHEPETWSAFSPHFPFGATDLRSAGKGNLKRIQPEARCLDEMKNQYPK